MSEAASWSASFGAAPKDAMAVYDDLFVPRLFRPMAEALLDELSVQAGDRVIDVACGPGTVALLAATRVGQVTACDISPAMLDIARSKPGAASVEWIETGAAPLTGVDDDAYSVATCQQGLQFFPDRVAALTELHRALVPGGRVGIAVWSAIEDSPAFAALAGALGDVVGPDVAATYRGGPWGLSDPDELAGLLDQAGFADVAVVRHTTVATFEGGAAQLVRTLEAAAVAPDVAALSEDAYDSLVAAVAERVDTQDMPFTTNVALGVKP